MQAQKRRGGIPRALLAVFVALLMVFSTTPTWAFGEESVTQEPTKKEEVNNQVTTPANGTTEQTNEPATDAQVTKTNDTNSNSSSVGSSSVPSEEQGVQVASSEESQPAKAEELAVEESASTKEGDALTEEKNDDADKLKAEANNAAPHVVYSGHVQNKGWMKEVRDGALAGTQGKGLRVEGLKIKLDLAKTGLTGGIEYRMHVQNKGWLGWVKDGALGGTTGKGLRVEAMQLRLYGDVAEKYNVYYSVHAQNLGWMAWANDGSSATSYSGTAGHGLRLEGVKIVLVAKNGGKVPDSKFVNYRKNFYGAYIIGVQAHVQNIGWQAAVGNGEIAGTTGRGLRVEALRISTAVGLDVPGRIQMEGHVSDKGWTGWKYGMVGTTGQGKRLEAVKLRLVGDQLKSAYDIYYRVHVANLGWLGWARNGEEAGTAGLAARVEAIQVHLVPKGTEIGPSGSIEEPFLTGTGIQYKAHSQNVGWGKYVSNGRSAGTTGKGLRMEAFAMKLSGGSIGGSVSYRAYVAGSGWQGYVGSEKNAGTIGKGRGIEGVQIRLTGRAAAMYDVYYRTHVSNAGWLGWAKNGESAGAPGTGRAVEAMQVKLVCKGGGAPGPTADHVVNKAWFEDAMLKRAQGYSSPTGWLIMVDVDKTKLGVYRGSQGHWSRVNKWDVSCGAPSSPTVKGVYSVSGRGYAFGHGYTCYWYTSWNGPYLFHSIKYDEGTMRVQDGRLNHHISGGCIRMSINNAKWIHDNIPDGTTVVTY